MNAGGPTRELVTFYQFRPLDDLPLLRERLHARARGHGLLGTVLLAPEGINGSLVGCAAGLDAFLTDLAGLAGCETPVKNRQTVDTPPFHRLKVRIRPEIIRFDLLDPALAEHTGERVAPAEWNALIRRPGVRLVDTRNAYETALGTFAGAENPGTDNFREFAAWAQANLDPERDREVAMFCTGGVRCEKASAWLKQKGFDHVYQLDGGILGYLAAVPPEDQTWQGECFVFDDRISVDARLHATGRHLCPACQHPAIDPEADGICRDCAEDLEPDRRARLAERARQIRLAGERGETHLGPEAGKSRG